MASPAAASLRDHRKLVSDNERPRRLRSSCGKVRFTPQYERPDAALDTPRRDLSQRTGSGRVMAENPPTRTTTALRPGGDDFFAAALAEERRRARLWAKEFARACKAGDVPGLYVACDGLNYAVDSWRLAMKRVGKLPGVSEAIREAFLSVWIESKMLPLRIGDRMVAAAALRVLLPCDYRGEPMRLYRGTRARERTRRLYGFSWTTSMGIAREFAEHWQQMEGGAVVLETVAPAEAVLLVREEPDYYDESEVVVDPYKIGRVLVAERLPYVPRSSGALVAP
jgi:hypothetical protein